MHDTAWQKYADHTCKEVQRVQMITPHKELLEIYKSHGILTLEQLIKLENIKLWYKHNNNSVPLQLRKNMTTDHRRHSLEKSHSYYTRNRKIPNLPQYDYKLV